MYTLAAAASGQIEIKKSRFFAHAGRVDHSHQALAFVDSRRDAAANHHCWAYRIGSAYRFYDDGEPAGTAGKPIFSAIEGADLDHVVVLVLRYFGGIKLGAGGLIRAYHRSAATCLDQAKRIEVRPQATATVEIPFDDIGPLYPILERFQAKRLKQQYGDRGLTVKIHLPRDHYSDLAQALRDATQARAILKLID